MTPIRAASSLALCAALAGCASAPEPRSACPPLQVYSQAMARAIAADMRRLGKDSAGAQALVDYRNMRRACGAE